MMPRWKHVDIESLSTLFAQEQYITLYITSRLGIL